MVIEQKTKKGEKIPANKKQSNYKRKTLNIYCKNLNNNDREETWETKI